MGYIVNAIRKKEFGDDVLITTDHGEWEIVNKDDYNDLIGGRVKDKKIYEILKRKGIIITKDNEVEIIKKLRERYSFLYRGASVHKIEIPNKEDKLFDNYLETIKNVVDFIFQSPTDNLTIELREKGGGLNFDLISYAIEYIKKKNLGIERTLTITILTNGNNLNGKILDFFEKEGVILCISFNGPMEFYDDRKLYSDTKKIINKYCNVQKESDSLKVYALPKLSSESIKYPRKLIDEYIKNNLNEIHLKFLNNQGYTSNEFINFWKESIEYLIKLNQEGKIIRERYATIMLRKIFESDPGYIHLRSPSSQIIGQLFYGIDGNIYTCEEGKEVSEEMFMLGNVKEKTYKEVLTSDKAVAIISASINDAFICDACPWKSWCGLCPACNYEEQKSLIPKITMTHRCKIHYAQFEFIFNKLRTDPITKKIFIKWLKKRENI